jgi:hypothetical protein
MSILEVNNTDGSNIVYDLNHYTTILVGRYVTGKRPDIWFPSSLKFISRVQCGFTLFPYDSGDRWVIKDGSLITMKNSSFGTFVNDIRLGDIEIRRLKNGDKITFSGQPCPLIKFICEELDSGQIQEEYPTSSYDFAERFSE